MKKLVVVLAVLFMTVSYAQTTINLNASKDKLEVTALRSDGFTMQNTIANLQLAPITTERGSFVSLQTEDLYKIFDEGQPNIPVLSKLIEVPQGAKVELTVKSFDEEIIDLAAYGITDKIMPALRSQSKSEDDVPFVINEAVYQIDDYINTKIAVYKESGQLRATRLGSVIINPIQYNPVRNTLRVLNNLVVDVQFINADLETTRALKTKYNTPYYTDMMSGITINHNARVEKELITQTPTHLVIVSDRMFEAQLAPFIAWKVKKGFQVTTAYTDDIGSTTTTIKSYLQDIYEGDNPMSFVLFVGDVAQIPAWDTGSHVTDLRYCEYTGDNLPEVYYGRFSAQNTSQLQPQIDKTLMYEQFTMADPSYLSEVFLVAGDDSNYEMVHGNGQLWYGNENYFNASNNINTHLYLQPLDNGAVHNIIIQDMNAGLALANYTAHCGPSGWANPSFDTSDVSSLTNNEKYGLWIGNCCLSVKFEESECFGEAALRKANGGAIGDIGGSNSTYWDEDYWWGVGFTGNIVAQPTYADTGRGAYDGLWHTEANEVDDLASWFTAQGQVTVCGNLAVEASTSPRKQYYWEIYHLMGDPTITNYIGTPQALTVTPSPGALMLGMSELNVASAPYTYVALSQDGVLIAAAVSDASGNANLTFESDALAIGTADLVVTGQNKIPHIGTIAISPADEPYVVLNSFTTNVATDYDTEIELNVTLENVAESGSGFNANGVSATISTSDMYIGIIDNSETYGDIDAGAINLINNAFSFDIAENVPDQHIAVFDISITDTNGHAWDTTFSVTLNAPEFTLGSMITINDAAGNNDGILDAGETADIHIQTTNTGHAVVSNVIGALTSASTAITINSATTNPAIDLAIGEMQEFVFNITADENAENGTAVDVNYTVTGGVNSQYTNTEDYEFTIGFVPEYCAAGADTTTDEFISNVLFVDIDNSSTVGPAYSDFSSISTDIARGASYPITISQGASWSSDQMGCWIDWNYDGDFDDANETFTIDYNHDNMSGTGIITVPTDARLGSTRMRLRVMYSGTLSPCGNASYGEVEDYTVNVQPTTGTTDFNMNGLGVYPNPNKGTFTVDFSRVSSLEEFSVAVFNINGQLVYHTTTSQNQLEINLSNVTGIYFLKVSSGEQAINKKLIVQ